MVSNNSRNFVRLINENNYLIVHSKMGIFHNEHNKLKFAR